MSSLTRPSVHVRRAPGAGTSTLAQDVRAGLAQTFKELPAKHLYDAYGSQLFDEICGLPEYYPTRTERAILEARADDIAARTEATELVEFGAGTAAKTRVLLDALRSAGTLAGYIPFDIEETVLRATALRLTREYPELRVIEAVVGDFEHDINLIPPPPAGGRRMVALLGGTIGNFVTSPRRSLLKSIATLLGPEGHLLLGADLVKDPELIESAYNDAAGVTARFNRNVLTIINRELDADFPVESFEHIAFYDRQQEWIEMRLRASVACRVSIRALEMEIEFQAGEEIRTEISAKFTPQRLVDDLSASGLSAVELMTDQNHLFALVLARPRPA